MGRARSTGEAGQADAVAGSDEKREGVVVRNGRAPYVMLSSF